MKATLRTSMSVSQLGEVISEALYTHPLLCRVVEDGYGRSCGILRLIGNLISQVLPDVSDVIQRGREESEDVGPSHSQTKTRGFNAANLRRVSIFCEGVNL